MPKATHARRKPSVVYPALSPAARTILGRAVDTIAPRPQTPKDRS
jgi:hypothetical protein